MRDPLHHLLWRKQLHPSRVADYERLHRDPWPELLDELRSRGVHEYEIYLDGDEALGSLWAPHPDLDVLLSPAGSDVLQAWRNEVAALGPSLGVRQLTDRIFYLP